MALVLSHNKGTLLIFNPKSSICCFIHKICAQQLPVAIYPASTVDNATHACFLLCHDIRLDPSKWHVPLVLFLSNLQLAKLESEYDGRVPSFRLDFMVERCGSFTNWSGQGAHLELVDSLKVKDRYGE